jgi:hypothetical protein
MPAPHVLVLFLSVSQQASEAERDDLLKGEKRREMEKREERAMECGCDLGKF